MFGFFFLHPVCEVCACTVIIVFFFVQIDCTQFNIMNEYVQARLRKLLYKIYIEKLML